MNSIAKEAIRNRAIRQDTRTDQSKWGVPNLAAPASRELVESAELTLGFALWKLPMADSDQAMDCWAFPEVASTILGSHS